MQMQYIVQDPRYVANQKAIKHCPNMGRRMRETPSEW
jgi:hypothetical protein